jgi:DNA-binding NarL/FixJ family response regulator
MLIKGRVIIVDPHVSVRQMLAQVLTQAIKLEIVGEAATGLEGLAICRKREPDLVICELMLPHLCGAEMLRRVQLGHDQVRSLIYSGASTDLQLKRAFRARPNGFVAKHDSLKRLCEAVQIVLEGGTYFSASVSKCWMSAHFEAQESTKLSNREREVLQMVAESSSSKDIATRLSLSVKTVQNHRMRLMEKLRIHDTAALTRFAIQEGLLS